MSRSKGELSDLERLDGHMLCCVAAVVGAFAGLAIALPVSLSLKKNK